MKKILGLDIGTNSIGWAFIESNAYENPETLDGKLIALGSRIIPMDGDALSKFESGTPESKAAGRRGARSARRLNQRYKLRRSRLVEALQILGWLPENFPNEKRNPNLFKKIDKHNINNYLPYSTELLKEVADFFEVSDKKTVKGEEYEISEDWVIYYLKTKALKKQVSLSELARILYHYNQRRGFKSSRKDAKSDEEVSEIKYPIYEKWVEIVTVINIEEKNKAVEKGIEYTFYELTCKAQGFEFQAIKKRRTPLDWLNREKEVEITRKTTKAGEVSYTISEVDPKAWENRKLALEKDIDKSGLTISEYYLNNLKADRNYRIKQRIVDRNKYQKEFEAIWDKQAEFYKTEFSDQDKINSIADSFYIHNIQKNKELKSKGLFHIFYNDIIYYQRGLKSQKGQLANCVYESKSFIGKNGEVVSSGVKVCNRSNPFFQEFRIWQTIHNLRIIQKESTFDGRLQLNIDVSDTYLTSAAKEKLFGLFDTSKEVSHDSILAILGFKKDKVEDGNKAFSYKLNYSDDIDFPGNETKALFIKVFKKCDFLNEGMLLLEDIEKFYQLWHIIYSLPEEKDIIKALNNKKYFDLPEHVVKAFSKLPEFKSQYASLSQRAILNLLPLMRVGKYWSQENLNAKTKNTKGFSVSPTINLFERAKEVNTTQAHKLPDKVHKEILKRDFSTVEELSGLPTFLAAYVAYGRHSERENEEKYEGITDFKINELIPHNTLRNPVVEKVIRETLKLVKDVWANETLGRPDFIHVELGRDLKKNNKEKQDATDINNKNKVEKDRIAALLAELKYPNFNPDSPADIDKFRLWKDQGGLEGTEEFNKLFKGGKAELISNAEIEKYRLWAEQGYKSPYTGKPIPLSWLYAEPKRVEIDHIIPRSKYYDDSFGNKVLVEAEFNSEKGNRLAIQFIEDCQNKEIELSDGSIRKVLAIEDYKKSVDIMFTNNKKKRHLKLYEVPEGFVERQMNDTKHISRTVAQFLRPIAKGLETIDEKGRKTIDEGVIYTSGSITSDLKNKWGLNKLWKELLRPRFERLEGILGEQLIIPDDTKRGEYHFGKDYKRVDHRHHALDALVIACTTRSHIKYLNTLNSLSNDKKDKKYEDWAKWKYLLKKEKELRGETVGMTEFRVPWGNSESFYKEILEKMQGVVVSHKATSKLVSITKNKYYRWKLEEGKWVKKLDIQSIPSDEDKYWVAVRQSLFGQPLGKIHLAEYQKEVELKKVVKAQLEFIKNGYNWNSEEWRIAQSSIRKRIDGIIKKHNEDEKATLKYFGNNPFIDETGNAIEKMDLLRFKKYASKRVSIDETFSLDKIKGLPYSELQKNWLTSLLREHLASYKNDPKEAFKGEGLEQLYKKSPSPINKVTRKEGGNKIELNNKLLDGDKGVNQYFIIETTKEFDKKLGEDKIVKKYSTPPFLECIERLAKNLPIHDENPNSQYTVLSPGDLVYVLEEGEDINSINWDNKTKIAERVYVMRSADALFIRADISKPIVPYDRKKKLKGEIGWDNKSDKTMDEKQIIKANCVKLRVDRLGNINPA